jgi:lipopolysaccharide biosynthesis regulator YciM|nr:MAG: hypothetical protein DIU56_11005 [Pseudomonadota bacterium]
MPCMRSLLVIVLTALLAGETAIAAQRDTDRLPVTRIRDLHYGDVLFYFYQDENFEAITRLNAYGHWDLLRHHGPESELLAGGLYLQLGLHNEAGARFEKLLTPDVPLGVRNRAWFYLAKVWYARGYLDRAEKALAQIQGTLTPALEAERQHLLANVLMRQERFDEAVRLLDGWRGPADWTAFAQFNLGVALVRQGRLDEADRFLSAVGTLETSAPELLALKDRANLALGFAYLQADQPAKARPVLERVRLEGPYSNKALLGMGWAHAALGDYRRALTPWLELRERNLLDAAVQESFLAVPYAFGRLEANAQAAEYYESAIRSFDEEMKRLDASIERIRSGRLLDELLAGDEEGRYGWFWQLRRVPDAPESRYLYAVLAGHDFQEGLKNYRDLAFLDGTLSRWSESMAAFEHMIETRGRAHAGRLERANALLASDTAERLQRARNDLAVRLDSIEAEGNVAALGTPEERDQWERIQRLEAALASAPDDEETAELRDRLRLVKGVLYFRLDEAFKARMWQQRRAIRDLDLALREMQNRWIRLERARETAPANTSEFAARVAALRARIAALQARLAAAAERQSEHLERLAVAELEAQKERLETYQVQARFALASIYDRAANADAGREQPAPRTPIIEERAP